MRDAGRIPLQTTASNGPDIDHWTAVAADWIDWARKPGHDSFWAYRDSFRAFVDSGRGWALDVGCGEGRVARDLTALGYRVAAADPVHAMVAAAKAAESAFTYAVAPASALPFPDSRFDLIVAYNVLMDFEDIPAALRELARVMKPSGRLVVSIVHPFTDRGRFADDAADAPFVMNGAYFDRERFEDVEERDGLRMRFAGWSQPLEAYAEALSEARLAITRLREPRPDLGDGRERMKRWSRLPLFLWLEAIPLPYKT